MSRFKKNLHSKKKRNITIGVCLSVILAVVTAVAASIKENNKITDTDLKKEENKKELNDIKTNIKMEKTNKIDENKKTDDKKTMDKKIENISSKSVDDSKDVTENKKQSTNIKTNEPEKEVNKGKESTFKSEKLGFSITFPESFENKYIVEETDDGINVYYKLEDKLFPDEGFLFTIKNKDKLEFTFEQSYNSIGTFKEFKAKGITYIIGGPLDVHISEERSKSELNMYSSMMKERYIVLNTLKEIN
ncbi:hypothetical protein [Clostridium sp. BJN0001]|uniref:hypothetical protein n=1 Tax=Clostridium sp. BJN0001 TaxID=2930219 RepID=UPI001FD0774D|nr:hypothetical protein [Clostridium sp. BJN0001]